MPPRNNSLPRLRRGKVTEPPKVMTWKKASPVLVVAGVFDALRAFFNFFWFFGPAVAAAYCTAVASETLSHWTFGLLGVKTAASLCAGTAIGAGALAVEVTAPLGVILADAVGLIAFLILGLWISLRNVRILKVVTSAPMQFAGAFAVSEVPILGSLPFFTFILWRLYRKQIRLEKAAYKKWEEETAAARAQEQRQQMLGVAQMQAAQQAVTQQELLRVEEEQYAELQEQQAANDEQYEIPDEVRSAA